MHYGSECFQRLLLQAAEDGERFDDPILDGRQCFFVHGGQDIHGQLPVIRALLDEREPAGRPRRTTFLAPVRQGCVRRLNPR